MKLSKVKLMCDYCGKEFERYASNIKPNRKHYCSKECMQESKKAVKEKRICKTCGKEFEVYASVLKSSNASGNFCSRECYYQDLEKIKGEQNPKYKRDCCICPNCGKEFYQIPSKIKAYQNVFCCRKCKDDFMGFYIGGDKNHLWKGGAKAYRGGFKKVKRQNFSGTQFCAVCGTTKDIHIHHIIPYRLTEDNSVDNLIPLCRKHHKKMESMTLPFIEMCEDKEIAKKYLNILFRSIQFDTLFALKKQIKERKNGNSKD